VSAEDAVRTELQDLRRQLNRLTLSLTEAPQPNELRDGAAFPSDVDDLTLTLGEQVRSGRPLSELVAVDATLSPIVALVGPPGVGKTTMLLKLAVRYGLAQRRSLQILSADVYRIAAADQLRSLCSILGIGCEVVETACALSHAIAEYRSKDLILIDTPGYTFRDVDEAADLGQALIAANVDTHLVLSACTKMTDLSRMARAYSCLHPTKLLFTHLDETSTFSCLANLSVESKLPLSFWGSGQLIPDDLEAAGHDRLRDLLFGGDAPVDATPRCMGAAA
jgi:flagellar biosynthesis protein FlhF